MSVCFAQLTESKISRDTARNSDTVDIVYPGVKSKVSGIQATVLRVSGTVAGKVYLMGTIDGDYYTLIDSLTLTNAAVNSKVFPFERSKGTSFTSYKVSLQTTGTQTSTLRTTLLRRPDE